MNKDAFSAPSTTQSGTINPTNTTTPSFADLGVPAVLVAALAKDGITQPFPIQVSAMPDALAGRDILGRGRTGSGKTIAFALPLIARLNESNATRNESAPRALVLVPTRELADQVHATIAPLARLTGLRATTVYGGVGYGPQVSTLRKGVDILIACPGRLEDLLKRRALRLDNVEITVLDEADHMTELGFLQPVRRILDQTPRDGQRLLFSATLDKRTDALVRYLDKPVTHSVDSESGESSDMEHHVFNVTDADKNAVVRELASGLGKTVLFTRTKHAASRLAKQLSVAGVPAVDLHGNLAQNARRRNLAAFTDGEVRVLVATDIAARGIHVDDIAIVVHVDPPEEHKAYLHRSGRTARAGARGLVVTLATPAQRGAVTSMTRRAGIKPKATHVKPGSTAITELTGPCAPVEHRAIASTPSAPARSHRRPAQGRPAQGRPAQGRSTQGRSEEGRPTQGRSGQGRSSQGRSSQGRSNQGRPTQGRPTSRGARRG